MTIQLEQTLRAIIEQDSDLFVKGDKGYIKLNIQEKAVNNDVDEFICLSCGNNWEANVSKVSVMFEGSVQKGRICVPCTNEIIDFWHEFPSMINVIPVPKEEIIEEVQESVGEKAREFTIAREKTDLEEKKYYRRKNFPRTDPSVLEKKAKESVQINDRASVKKLVLAASIVHLPQYAQKFDDGLKNYNLSRREAIVIARVASHNLQVMHPYMINYFLRTNNKRFNSYLENGWNVTDRQAKQIDIAFDLLKKAKILDKDKNGKLTMHKELK